MMNERKTERIAIVPARFIAPDYAIEKERKNRMKTGSSKLLDVKRLIFVDHWTGKVIDFEAVEDQLRNLFELLIFDKQ